MRTSFQQLPGPARSAIRAFCREMDPAEFKLHVTRFSFSLETISMAAAKRRSIERLTDGFGHRPFATFDEYHRWYMQECGPIPNYPTQWPVIEGDPDGWLEDGSHRFHSYVEAGDQTVPVLRFHPQLAGHGRAPATRRPLVVGGL
jgi:hypothetical protein